MLVLTRKLNQSIVLTDKRTGQKVEVFLVEVRGTRCAWASTRRRISS